jgi:hypothetical protein
MSQKPTLVLAGPWLATFRDDDLLGELRAREK